MSAVPQMLVQDRFAQRVWTSPDDQQFRLRIPSSPCLADLFSSRRLVDRDGNSVPLNVYVPQEEGQILYSLVRHLRPKASLEIGLANGISALYIAQALHDNAFGTHLAIDPFQHCHWKDQGLTTLRSAGLDHWVQLDARLSHWVLPDLEQAGKQIQFAFVDGSHLMDYVMADFLGIDRILEIGGLIAFDDSDWPAVTHVIRFAITNRRYEVFETGRVVEACPIRPRLASRLVRLIARRAGGLRRILRPSFITPDHELGIQGRCAVIKKTAHDDRDNQTQTFVDF